MPEDRSVGARAGVGGAVAAGVAPVGTVGELADGWAVAPEPDVSQRPEGDVAFDGRSVAARVGVAGAAVPG